MSDEIKQPEAEETVETPETEVEQEPAAEEQAEKKTKKKKEKGKKREKVSVNTVKETAEKPILTDAERDKLIAELTREMTSAAMALDFERAAKLRDRIAELKT